jgi:uncharacterized Tic20 family protein
MALICVVVGWVLVIAVAISNLILVIVGAVKANNGEFYRYPMCIRFIK